jgi:hypothetical protein
MLTMSVKTWQETHLCVSKDRDNGASSLAGVCLAVHLLWLAVLLLDSVAVVKVVHDLGVNLRPVGLSQELDTCAINPHVSHASFTH